MWIEFENEAHCFKADYHSFSNFNASISFQGYTTFKGIFKTLIKSKEPIERSFHYTAIIKCPDNNFIGSHFPATQLKVNTTTYAARIIELLVEQQQLHIYLHERSELQEHYLFVENIIPSDYRKFVTILHELLLVLTYTTGTFPGKEIFVLKDIFSESSKREIVSTFVYAEKLLNSQYGAIPKLNSHVPEHNVLHIKLGLKTLADMISKCINEPSYRRTILLMIHANAQPDYIKVVSYAVALESISKLIYELNKQKMKPINDKALFNEIRNKLHLVIDEYVMKIADKNVVTKIKSYLDNINKPSNAEMLTKPFEIYSIPIDDLDKEAIKKRNDFLHGRLPSETGSHELAIIGYRLQYCVNALIMKYCNYNGGVIYQASLYQHYNNLKIDSLNIIRVV